MMFHPKHVLIKYEFQKHHIDHQSDILLRAAKKFWKYDFRRSDMSGTAMQAIYVIFSLRICFSQRRLIKALDKQFLS